MRGTLKRLMNWRGKLFAGQHVGDVRVAGVFEVQRVWLVVINWTTELHLHAKTLSFVRIVGARRYQHNRLVRAEQRIRTMFTRSPMGRRSWLHFATASRGQDIWVQILYVIRNRGNNTVNNKKALRDTQTLHSRRSPPIDSQSLWRL